MEVLGIDVTKEQKGRETYYRVCNRKFELAEIKLLIDAVQSSKFITEKKSRELIKKIKTLVSEYQARQLQRQVFVQGRVKTVNETIYYDVDEIHNAIAENQKIQFQYLKWDINKKLVPKHDRMSVVSPWCLLWEDENYYLIAYDEEQGICKHYRVDKIVKISRLEQKRQGKEIFEKLDMAAYSKATFGMYHGQMTRVKIAFSNDLCGVFFDRFGKDISIRSIDQIYSEVIVEVAVSPQFFGWIFSLGKKVKVTGPNEVVEQLLQYATQEFLKNYSERTDESYENDSF